MVTRRPCANVGQQFVTNDAARVEIGAQERHRMRLQRQVQMAIVLDHLLARRHRRQMRRPARAPACATRANSGRSSLSPARRSAFTAHSASRRLRPSELKASACASFSSAFGGSRVRSQRSRTESKPRAAHAFDGLAPFLGEAVDLAKAEAQRVRRQNVSAHRRHDADADAPSAAQDSRLQRAIPVGTIDIDRPHLDAMLLRVAHELRRGVETHRLAVEQRRREHVGVMAFDPGRGIDQIGKARGVALRESRSCRSLRSASSNRRRTSRRSRARPCPSRNFSSKLSMVPTRLNVAIARRSRSASPGAKPAPTMAMRMACSWNSGTPSVFAENASPVSLRRIDDLFAALRAAADRDAPCCPGSARAARSRLRSPGRRIPSARSRGSIDICARLSIWNTPMVSARWIMS